MRSRTSLKFLATVLTVTAAGFSNPVGAQDDPGGRGAQSEPIEVVVVTGFRPESLARSTGSVAVVDAAVIEQRGAEHLEAVIGVAPNVTMSSGASRGRFIQMRGIGDLEQFVDPKHYPSVGVSLDGIDLGGIANAAMLFDVAQVEVHRGPQGTRLGASALAGHVDIVSVQPGDSFDGYIELGIADYATRMLGVAVGGPLADRMAGRVAVQSHRSDGYIDNAFLGRDDTNGYEENSFKAQLRFTPRDTVALDVSAFRFDSNNGYDAFSLDNSRTTLSDAPGRDDLALAALGLTAVWQLAAGGTLELSLSQVDSEIDYGFDEDWAFVGLCDGTACNPGDGFSNTDLYVRERDDRSLDLTWIKDSDASGGPLGFVLGLYAQDRSESLARQYYGPFASDYAADRLAVYGQLDISLAERLAMTVGLRHETFDDSYSDSFAFVSQSDDDLTTGEVSLRFTLSEARLLYMRLATGAKPGGVNTEASSAFSFVEPRFQNFLDSRRLIGQESLTSVEFGLKSQSSSGRLALRAAIFAMSRDDAQLESWFWDPTNFLWVGILDNADGDNLGAELDVDWRVSDRWQLTGAIGLLDTEIDMLTTFDLDADDFVIRRSIDQTRAPEWTAYLGSRWTLGDAWRVSLELEAADSQRYGYYHDGRIGRSTLVNASLAKTLGATDLTLWARNLSDEDYAVHGLYFGNDPRNGYLPTRYLQPGEPRLVGVTLKRAF